MQGLARLLGQIGHSLELLLPVLGDLDAFRPRGRTLDGHPLRISVGQQLR